MAKIETTAASTNTVTVGCKLPHGLVLELGGVEVTINGVNSSLIVGGFGLTEGVDAAFFDAWMSANKHTAIVKNELIFAQSKTSEAQAEAKDKAANKSGLEGLGKQDLPKGVTEAEG